MRRSAVADAEPLVEPEVEPDPVVVPARKDAQAESTRAGDPPIPLPLPGEAGSTAASAAVAAPAPAHVPQAPTELETAAPATVEGASPADVPDGAPSADDREPADRLPEREVPDEPEGPGELPEPADRALPGPEVPDEGRPPGVVAEEAAEPGAPDATPQRDLPVAAEQTPPTTDDEPPAPAAPVVPTSVKVVVAGGFAVGKTTFIGSLSDIAPLRTEAAMTEKSLGVDVGARAGKTSTTVALDFGRIALPGDLWLYLFGTPGQDRFLFLWDDLVRGAIGAVVLVDTERLDQCFAAVDYFESRGIPFVVAVNCFDGIAHHDLEDVRDALGVGADVPFVYVDARQRPATRHALVTLVQHAVDALDA